MLISIISPAKKLDFTPPTNPIEYSIPKFLKRSSQLILKLKEFSADDISKLMKLSNNLSELNYSRYHNFKTPFNQKNAKQAILAFKGDTYIGLDVSSFSKSNISYASKQLRILSGLYGVLSPLDLIQPYRLEMGTRFQINPQIKNLYQFWKQDITSEIKQLLGTQNILINLASQEYFAAIDTSDFTDRVITPGFKQNKNGEIKSIGMMSKRARGMMAAYIIKNKITKPADLEQFSDGGYKYSPSLSTTNQPIFIK